MARERYDGIETGNSNGFPIVCVHLIPALLFFFYLFTATIFVLNRNSESSSVCEQLLFSSLDSRF